MAKKLFFLLMINVLLIGVTSCSDDEVVTKGNESYITGLYSNDKLIFTLDGSGVSNVKADISVKDNLAVIELTGFPESNSVTKWTAAMTETGNGVKCAGEEKPYRYEVSFEDVLGSKKCKITVETMN